MRRITLKITEELSGRTVKNLLKRELQLSHSLISHLKFVPGGITVNGRPARTTEKLSAGDLLCAAAESCAAASGERPDWLLYENDDLLVMNKPAGLEMHPDGGADSVRSRVAEYFGEGAVFHPVNRLDCETSGLLVVAKNRYSCDRLRRQLHTEDFRREYLALCHGTPPPEGAIDLPIAKEHRLPRRIAADGMPSRTEYTVLWTNGDYSLLRVRLRTGRTHQIRLHLAAAGCPLVGDAMYGSPHPAIARTALHSAFAEIRLPLSGERLRVFCPPPQDFAEAVRLLTGGAVALTEKIFCDITD